MKMTLLKGPDDDDKKPTFEVKANDLCDVLTYFDEADKEEIELLEKSGTLAESKDELLGSFDVPGLGVMPFILHGPIRRVEIRKGTPAQMYAYLVLIRLEPDIGHLDGLAHNLARMWAHGVIERCNTMREFFGLWPAPFAVNCLYHHLLATYPGTVLKNPGAVYQMFATMRRARIEFRVLGTCGISFGGGPPGREMFATEIGVLCWSAALRACRDVGFVELDDDIEAALTEFESWARSKGKVPEQAEYQNIRQKVREAVKKASPS